MKKPVKGYFLLALALGVVIQSCASKTPTTTTTDPLAMQSTAVEPLNQEDLTNLGVDNTGTNSTINTEEPPTSEEPTSEEPTSEEPTSEVPTSEVPATTSASPTVAVSATATVTASPTATVTASPTATVTATPTATPTPTATATPTPTATPVPTPTATPDPYGNEVKTSLGEGLINQPRGIDIVNGKIYLSVLIDGFMSDSGGIKILDTGGNLVKTITGGTFDGLPTDLTGCASDGSRVWIVNRLSAGQSANNIFSYTTSGEARQNARIGLTTAQEFYDISVYQADQAIYVASGGTSSVIKVNYNANGVRTDTQQLYFTGATPITPAGIGLDEGGNLLVTDARKGTFIALSKTGTKAYEYTTKGKNGTGPEVSMIGDVAYDPRKGGIIYILARVNNKNVILRYDNEGNYFRTFGASAEMQEPQNIAVGADGTVYVTDKAKNIIHQFAPGQ